MYFKLFASLSRYMDVWMLAFVRSYSESLAGDSPFCLEESLRWARAVVGVDRELLKLGRRRLPNVRLHEKLLQAIMGQGLYNIFIYIYIYIYIYMCI
jgi:hypothetical protein